MFSAIVLPIPKSDPEAEYIIALVASKVCIIEILIQCDAARSLESCIYWARILNDCEAYYRAYDREALVVVKTLYPV